MRYSSTIAACLLLYTKLTSCQISPPASDPSNVGNASSGPTPATSAEGNGANPQPAPTSPSQEPKQFGSQALIDLVSRTKNGSGDGAFVQVEILGVQARFAIDVSGTTTYVFSKTMCIDSTIPLEDCSHITIDAPSGSSGFAQFKEWHLSTVESPEDLKLGNSTNLLNIPCSFVTGVSSGPFSFKDDFKLVDGILGLGDGSPVLSQLSSQDIAEGYSLYFGSSAGTGVQGSLVFGGYNPEQFNPSPETGKLFGGLNNITVEDLLATDTGETRQSIILDGKKASTRAIIDPTSRLIVFPPNLIKPQSMPNNNFPNEITLIFPNGFNITVSTDQHQSKLDGDTFMVGTSGSDITLGRPFLRAAYLGVESNNDLFIGSPNPTAQKNVAAFANVDSKINPSSSGRAIPTSTGFSSGDAASSGPKKKKKSNVGPIVGGVIGGLAVIALLAFLFLCCRRRRRSAGYGRKRGMSKEFPDEDEMARGINATNSFGSQEVSREAQENAYAPLPPPPPRLTPPPPEPQEVRNDAGVTTYDPSPVTPAMGGPLAGSLAGSALPSAHNTQPNSAASSPLESKRFSGFSGIARKPVPQRASRQINPDSDDEADEVSVRSPASEYRATSPIVDEHRASYQPRDVPRLPFNRGGSDAPAF